MPRCQSDPVWGPGAAWPVWAPMARAPLLAARPPVIGPRLRPPHPAFQDTHPAFQGPQWACHEGLIRPPRPPVPPVLAWAPSGVPARPVALFDVVDVVETRVPRGRGRKGRPQARVCTYLEVYSRRDLASLPGPHGGSPAPHGLPVFRPTRGPLPLPPGGPAPDAAFLDGLGQAPIDLAYAALGAAGEECPVYRVAALVGLATLGGRFARRALHTAYKRWRRQPPPSWGAGP